MLLSDERAVALLEYEPGNIILSLATTDLLIVKDWVAINVIRETNSTNMLQFLKLPLFDAMEYPFIICSGFKNIKLINVRKMNIQAFIDVPCNSTHCQQAYFF